MGASHNLVWKESSLLNSTAETVSGATEGALTPEDIGITFLFVLAAFNSFSSLVGTPGNVLTIAAILLTDSLHCIPDMFILSLSFSDLIVVAVYQPINAYRYSNLRAADTSSSFLEFKRFIGYTSLIASATSLFGITVERLISIRFPLKYELYVTFKRALYAVAFIWLLCIATGCVYIKKGAVSRRIPQTYFLLILLATVVMYVYILIVARRHEKAMVAPQVGNQRSSAYNRKAARTIAIVLGVFLTCWLPFLILPACISEISHPVMFNRLFKIFLTLSTCHSTINPFVYCFRSERYRGAVAKLVGLA